MSVISVARFKTCTVCGVTKPAVAAFFHAKKGGKYGLRSKCRTCRSIAKSGYYHANSERLNTYTKAWLDSARRTHHTD